MTRSAYTPDPNCPNCTDTLTVPTRPTGSGSVAACLNCGTQFLVHEGGAEIYPGGPLSSEELAERRGELK